MKRTLHALAVIGVLASAPTNAQRCLTEQFSSVDVQSNVVYGQNFSVLTGTPQLQPLVMDVYTPAGDSQTDRPLIVYISTPDHSYPVTSTSWLQVIRLIATVEMCRRFAKKGYVVAAISYRTGWNPGFLCVLHSVMDELARMMLILKITLKEIEI